MHQQGPPQRRSRDRGRRLSWRKGPGATGRPAWGSCTGGRGGGEKGALVGRWAWGLGRKAQTLEGEAVGTGQGSLPVLPHVHRNAPCAVRIVLSANAILNAFWCLFVSYHIRICIHF